MELSSDGEIKKSVKCKKRNSVPLFVVYRNVLNFFSDIDSLLAASLADNKPSLTNSTKVFNRPSARSSFANNSIVFFYHIQSIPYLSPPIYGLKDNH